MTTTAEHAASYRSHHACGETQRQMLSEIRRLRQQPAFAPYLDHSDIVVGLAEGRLCIANLRVRLADLAKADNMEPATKPSAFPYSPQGPACYDQDND